MWVESVALLQNPNEQTMVKCDIAALVIAIATAIATVHACEYALQKCLFWNVYADILNQMTSGTPMQQIVFKV